MTKENVTKERLDKVWEDFLDSSYWREVKDKDKRKLFEHIALNADDLAYNNLDSGDKDHFKIYMHCFIETVTDSFEMIKDLKKRILTVTEKEVFSKYGAAIDNIRLLKLFIDKNVHMSELDECIIRVILERDANIKWKDKYKNSFPGY